MSDVVTPTNDGVFKLLFAAEDNRPGLIGLLTAVLQPPVPISNAKVLNPEIPKENITDKGTTLDILVELADGSRINVEMQMVPGKYLIERAYYYAARTYVSMLKRGQKYERLKPVHVIYLLHDTYFHEAPDTYHFRFRPREVQNLAEIHSMMTVHFVEIAKACRLLRRGNGQANEEGLNPWLQFLHNPDDQGLNEVMTHMPELNETKKKFERLRRDPQAREIARLRDKALSDYNTAIDVARKEGRQEGRQEGKQENIDATLRRLLSSPKYADMTDADIAEIAGTDVASVATMRKLLAAGG